MKAKTSRRRLPAWQPHRTHHWLLLVLLVLAILFLVFYFFLRNPAF